MIIFLTAAIPAGSNETVSTDVFRNTSAVLMCPIPLPTVRSLYTVIWEQIVDSTAIQLMNSRQYTISQDNRTLSVPILNSTDQRVFRCRVNLRRCSVTQRCELNSIMGPFMKFRVLGKICILIITVIMIMLIYSERSAITVPPSSQAITNGDTAIFHCNAKGSNISVRWIFNGLSCGPDSCGRDGIFISRTQSGRNSNLFMIITTLEIRTGEFRSVTMRNTIQCIVKQNLDFSSLRGDDINVTSTLTINLSKYHYVGNES